MRRIRGPVIAVGRSHDPPELVVNACAAFELKTLYTSKNPMTRARPMRNVFSVRRSNNVLLDVRRTNGTALMIVNLTAQPRDRNLRRIEGGGDQVRGVGLTCALAAATTLSAVKPYSFCRAFKGAEAPKVCIAMTRPVRPT